MAVLRWGICSAGNISQDFSHTLVGLENHKIQAVAARKEEDAEKLAKEVGAETFYGGYEKLAADEKVDIVYIGSLHIKHLEHCKLFLEAGKHVLCEKPLAMHAGEVEQIIECAKKSGKFFMEAIWSRFLPSFEKVRSLIAAGEIGEVKYIMGDFSYIGAHQPRAINKDTGGGGLYDIGIYLVQLATMVLGPDPEVIQGIGGLNQSGVDETCSITLKYPGNVVCNMVSCLTAFGNQEATIFGTTGRIKLTGPFHCGTSVELIRGFPLPGMFEKQVFECPLPVIDHKFNFANSTGLRLEAQAVREAIQQGKVEHPLMQWSESLAVCRILDKLRHDLGYYWPGEVGAAK